MAVSMTCDWCGQPIESVQDDSGVGSARVRFDGLYEDFGLVFERVGNFHAGRRGNSDSCAGEVLRALRGLIEDSHPMPAAEPDPVAAWEERRNLWRAIPKPGRMSRILNALGEDSLALREVADRLQEQIPGADIDTSDLQPLAHELRLLGELEREPTGRNAGRYPKWRYHRARPSTDLAAFERTLQGEGGAA